MVNFLVNCVVMFGLGCVCAELLHIIKVQLK
jgi:hypothetical protein